METTVIRRDAAPERVSESDALERPPLPADVTQRYGPNEAQEGDLRVPDTAGPHPVAVILHGGCWRAIADRRYMEPLAAVLTVAGWATWTVGYRTVDHEGGGYPGTFRDVAEGIDHLRRLAPRYALDLARVVTVGHSAGGHLALWGAARHRIPASAEVGSPDPLAVRGVVGLAPITGLEAFDALERRGCGDAVRSLLGGVTSRLRLTSPARLLPLGVPQLLVVGGRDGVVPPGHVREYGSAAREAGDTVEVAVVEGAGHFEVVAPWWARWDAVDGRVLGFLKGLATDSSAAGPRAATDLRRP